jgi:hypothetical protein
VKVVISGSEWRPNEVNPDGPSVEVKVYTVSATADEWQAILAAYDPSSTTSPSAGNSRALARSLLDIVLEDQ